LVGFSKLAQKLRSIAMQTQKSSFKPVSGHQGVNFINILHTHFSYKSALPSFSLVTFWLWQKYKSTFVQKTRA